MSRINRRVFHLTTLAAGLLASGVVMADAFLEPALASKLAAALPNEALPVVVSYRQSGPVTSSQLAFMRSLGITRGVYMRSLPVMGVVATPALINQIAQQPDVVSIYRNAPVKLLNYEQRQQSGIDRVVLGQDPHAFAEVAHPLRIHPYDGHLRLEQGVEEVQLVSARRLENDPIDHETLNLPNQSPYASWCVGHSLDVPFCT